MCEVSGFGKQTGGQSEIIRNVSGCGDPGYMPLSSRLSGLRHQNFKHMEHLGTGMFPRHYVQGQYSITKGTSSIGTGRVINVLEG